MLTSLIIHELAVVKHLDLDFQHGFTTLTGETGAGKSILLNALGMALGERADVDLIRDDAPRAEVILEFDMEAAPAAKQWLCDNDLDTGETCLIRRTIAAKGRSRAFVNDRPVSLQALQALGRHLVEIHGQHAHLRLRQASAQRALLDTHAGHDDRLTELATVYRDWHAAHDKVQRLRQSDGDQHLREEFLRFQIQELEAASIENLDFDALLEEHTRLANLDKVLSSAQQQCLELYDADHAASSRIDQAAQELETVAEWAPEFREPAELLRSAQIQLEEAGHSLRRSLDHLEDDPERLAQLDQQLSLLHDLARKHQVAPQELPQKLSQMREELNQLGHQEDLIAELEEQLQQLTAHYREAAANLSRCRRDHATLLAQRITELMRELGMPHGEFQISVHTDPEAEPRREGLDQVEFLVTTNPGLPPRPLTKVASGGELSRLSLAIQVACSEARPVPTLVFDEVDTGIGGGVAEIVGRRLRELGHNRQILCVTHLPQVAAQAHQHLQVKKDTSEQGTQTRVVPLTATDRREEIARMLGGVRITDQTLAHAEEMLQWAH